MPKRKSPLRVDNLLKSIYYDPKHPYSFSSPYNLFKAAQKRNRNIKLKDVTNWLEGEDTYTLYRPIITKFRRRKVLVPGVQYQYQADLLDYEPLNKQNNKTMFLLTIIDCFSRFALALPLKSKKGEEVCKSLQKSFEVMGIPKKLQTDKGKEFYNFNVKNLLDKLNIHHFSTDQQLKAQIVECFNQNLREKINKYMVSRKSLRYIDALPDILLGYNSKIHGSLKKFAPKDVNKKNEEEVHHIQYEDYFKSVKKTHAFKINDTVRISAYRGIFAKSFHKTFTEEIFIITDLLKTQPPTYRLRDKNNEILPGSFYESELQKVRIK